MTWTSRHLNWFTDTDEVAVSAEGEKIPIFEFSRPDDDEVMTEWATHFRNHYCGDNEIDLLRNGTGLTRGEYLTQIKFPTRTGGFGPGIRSGDFSEILVSDYFQYVLDYWIPRTRYDRKTIQNESEKGSDLLAFKFTGDDESPSDTLAVCEVKAQMSGKKPKNKLQEAVNDSVKDSVRLGESLNAVKQRLIDKNETADATKITRFQNPVDHPYNVVSGAAALFNSEVCDSEVISTTDTSTHPNKNNLFMIVIRGKQFMTLIHELYERAANEA